MSLPTDPAWFQGAGRGRKLAAVFRAVPSTAKGETGSLLWRLDPLHPPKR